MNVTVATTTKRNHSRDRYIDVVSVTADSDSGALDLAFESRNIVYEKDEWFSYTVQNDNYPPARTLNSRPEETLPTSVYTDKVYPL